MYDEKFHSSSVVEEISELDAFVARLLGISLGRLVGEKIGFIYGHKYGCTLLFYVVKLLNYLEGYAAIMYDGSVLGFCDGVWLGELLYVTLGFKEGADLGVGEGIYLGACAGI